MKALCSSGRHYSKRYGEAADREESEALEAEAANIIRRSLVTDAIFAFHLHRLPSHARALPAEILHMALGIPPEHIDVTVRQKCLDSSSFDKSGSQYLSQ